MQGNPIESSTRCKLIALRALDTAEKYPLKAPHTPLYCSLCTAGLHTAGLHITVTDKATVILLNARQHLLTSNLNCGKQCRYDASFSTEEELLEPSGWNSGGKHGEGRRWIGAEWGRVCAGVSPLQPTRGSGGASYAPPEGAGAPRPKTDFGVF